MSFLAIAVLQDDGLTFREVIQNIPHDGPAVVIYLMLALFAWFIWWGNRNSGSGTPSDGTGDRTEEQQGGKDRDRA